MDSDYEYTSAGGSIGESDASRESQRLKDERAGLGNSKEFEDLLGPGVDRSVYLSNEVLVAYTGSGSLKITHSRARLRDRVIFCFGSGRVGSRCLVGSVANV